MKIKNHLDSKIENLESYINNDSDELSYDVLQDLYNLTGGMSDDDIADLTQRLERMRLNPNSKTDSFTVPQPQQPQQPPQPPQPPQSLLKPPTFNLPPQPPESPQPPIFSLSQPHQPQAMHQGPIDNPEGNAAVDRAHGSGASVNKPDCVESKNIDGTLQNYIEDCWEDDIVHAKITWVKHRHNKLIGSLSKNLTPLKKILLEILDTIHYRNDFGDYDSPEISTMDTEIIEYGGNSITLLTLIENMYNAVETHEIENILTFTFKIYEIDLTHRIEEIVSPLFVYAIFQSQCKRHKTEDHCKLDKKCHWNSTDNKCGWKYQPSLERDIVEAEEIINIEQSIKFFIIDEDEFLENAILSANPSSKNMIISKFVIYLDDNLKLTKFKVDKRTVDGYAKLIKIGTEDSLDVNLIKKKLFLQIFVGKISDYLKIWEQNITLSEDKSEKDRHNLKRLQILIENLTKFDSFCKKNEWLIDSIYKDRLSSYINVLKNIKLNVETDYEVYGSYEDWINTFIVHSLNCNLQLQYNIRYGIIAYKLVAMMRNLLRNHPTLFTQTGGMGEDSTLSGTMTMTLDRVEDVKEALRRKEGIPEDQKKLIFGYNGQIFLPKNPNYSKIEAQHIAQKEQAIEEVKKLSSEELRQKRLKKLGMIKSEFEPQPQLTPEPQNLESMCKDIENIVDPQIYAKIRILKCGTVTEADMEDITRQFANLSLHPNEVKNVDEVKKMVKKITKTQETKVKSEVESEVDSEESFGLDKLYSDEDLNTISKVTEIDNKDAPLVVTIVDESAKNEVSISLDNKFEDYGLADLFAPTEEPPTPVPAPPQATSAAPVVQAISAEPPAQAISAEPPAPPSDVLLPKISIIIREPPSDFGVQEIRELPPKPEKSEEPKKPMSRYQKLYALANSVSNMVTSSLDIMHPYNGIIKYKDILIKTYEAPRKDIAHFFEYILKGLKLVIIEVPRLCYNLIQLLLVSLYDFVNTGIINVETFLNNIYQTISKYFVNTIGKISNMCIVGIFTYCIPAITDLYRYLRYNIVPIPLKFIELSRDKFVTSIKKINTAMEKLGTYSEEFCSYIYVLLLEAKRFAIYNIDNMWSYITTKALNTIDTVITASGEFANNLREFAINSYQLGQTVLIFIFSLLQLIYNSIPFEQLRIMRQAIINSFISGIGSATGILVTLFDELPTDYSALDLNDEFDYMMENMPLEDDYILTEDDLELNTDGEPKILDKFMFAYNKSRESWSGHQGQGRKIIKWIIKAGGELIKFFGINALKVLYNVLKGIVFMVIYLLKLFQSFGINVIRPCITFIINLANVILIQTWDTIVSGGKAAFISAKMIGGLIVLLCKNDLFNTENTKQNLIQNLGEIMGVARNWGTGIIYNLSSTKADLINVSASAVNFLYSFLSTLTQEIEDSRKKSKQPLSYINEPPPEIITTESITEQRCPSLAPHYCSIDTLFRTSVGKGNVSPCVRKSSDCNKTYSQVQLSIGKMIESFWSKKCTSKIFETGDLCTDDEHQLYCPASHPTFCSSDSEFRNNRRKKRRSLGNRAPCVTEPDHCDEPYEIVSNATTDRNTSKKCKAGLEVDQRGDQCHKD